MALTDDIYDAETSLPYLLNDVGGDLMILDDECTERERYTLKRVDVKKRSPIEIDQGILTTLKSNLLYRDYPVTIELANILANFLLYGGRSEVIISLKNASKNTLLFLKSLHLNLSMSICWIHLSRQSL